MILVAICDNDEGATFQIEELIESTYEKHGVEMEIDVYYSGEKLAEAISQGKMYDIIYLDIQMGGLDGLAVGKYIRKMELDSIIVYISEYIEYIESVFEVEAFEFIRKPISEYYGTAEPPVRCGESHLSGLTEPLHFVY